jgi:hypothetical protein
MHSPVKMIIDVPTDHALLDGHKTLIPISVHLRGLNSSIFTHVVGTGTLLGRLTSALFHYIATYSCWGSKAGASRWPHQLRSASSYRYRRRVSYQAVQLRYLYLYSPYSSSPTSWWLLAVIYKTERNIHLSWWYHDTWYQSICSIIPINIKDKGGERGNCLMNWQVGDSYSRKQSVIGWIYAVLHVITTTE